MLFLNMIIGSPEMKTYPDKSLSLTGLKELNKGRGLHRDKISTAANKNMNKLSPPYLSRRHEVFEIVMTKN